MRYLFGTGIIGAITAGATLLRGSRDAPITWRAVLAWASWGITLALAVGTAIDARRAERGLPVADDSPIAAKQAKERAKAEKDRKKKVKELAR
ncbi:hypothetical protein [Microbacterium sp. SD291]|uniref:hypothetical protein n=1 Tax=Microbacterium sp. SD291 TaxID=2782007 RepID=UPI001A95B63D|nr:hypothetical protein [Microbacterium sp. SD291]MBO0979502.1 hypothetical protein [Microbacterium sp. SD291]